MTQTQIPEPTITYAQTDEAEVTVETGITYGTCSSCGTVCQALKGPIGAGVCRYGCQVTQTQILVRGALADMAYCEEMVNAHLDADRIDLADRWARMYHRAACRVIDLTGKDPRPTTCPSEEREY